MGVIRLMSILTIYLVMTIISMLVLVINVFYNSIKQYGESQAITNSINVWFLCFILVIPFIAVILLISFVIKERTAI